jgi:hypothetical protein
MYNYDTVTRALALQRIRDLRCEAQLSRGQICSD